MNKQQVNNITKYTETPENIMRMVVSPRTANIIALQTHIQAVRYGIMNLDLTQTDMDLCIRSLDTIRNTISVELQESILCNISDGKMI